MRGGRCSTLRPPCLSTGGPSLSLREARSVGGNDPAGMAWSRVCKRKRLSASRAPTPPPISHFPDSYARDAHFRSAARRFPANAALLLHARAAVLVSACARGCFHRSALIILGYYSNHISHNKLRREICSDASSPQSNTDFAADGSALSQKPQTLNVVS